MHLSVYHIVFGLSLFSLGLYLILVHRQILLRGKKVKGIVKEVKFDGEVYYPVVEFNDEGNLHDKCFYKLRYGSNRFDYKIGAEVELVYLDNGIKKKVRINSWVDLWMLPIILVGSGALSIAYGFFQW